MNTKPLHRVSERLASIAPSQTIAVDTKSKAMKAAGDPVINFGPGEPDFSTPHNIVEAAMLAVQNPADYKYTPVAGLKPLRDAIAEQTAPFGDIEITGADNVLITNGGKQGVFEACAAIINEGDEVLLPAPYWTSYPEMIALAGGVTVPVLARYDNDYKVTVEELEAARTDKTIAMIFCSPSNPSGAVYTPDEVKALGEWALEHGIWVITDEIYDKLVYDGGVAQPIYQAVPELANQTIAVNGVAKSYAMTGWRVGWMVAPADIIKAATSFQSHLTSNVNNIAQRATIEALTGPQTAVRAMRETFNTRRKLLVSMLREIEVLDVPDPMGAFYVFVRADRALGREYRGRMANTTAELAEIILEDALVAVVPGEAFGVPGTLRFSYALADNDLIEGAARLQKFLA